MFTELSWQEPEVSQDGPTTTTHGLEGEDSKDWLHTALQRSADDDIYESDVSVSDEEEGEGMEGVEM